jgi:hypothetical protein
MAILRHAPEPFFLIIEGVMVRWLVLKPCRSQSAT